MSNAVFKRGETTRLRARYSVGATAQNFDGKTLKVKVHDTANGLPLAAAIEPQSGATLGYFWFECTPANLNTLGNPEQVMVTATAWNADNTLFMDADPVVIAVEF
jgi:hypothetical protein